MGMHSCFAKSHRGRASHYAGHAAEEIVRRHYLSQGAESREHRWRGKGAEIDLIFEQDGETIFVEVKTAVDFATATARLGPRQITRLYTAAEEYLSIQSGQAPQDCRFDVALVDATGRIEVLENAFA